MAENIQRRTLLNAGSWAVPAVAIAVAAPMAAASGNMISGMTATLSSRTPDFVTVLVEFSPTKPVFNVDREMFQVDGITANQIISYAPAGELWRVSLRYSSGFLSLGQVITATVPGYGNFSTTIVAY